MKWKIGEPQLGDMIRVRAGSVLHYGIYVTDSEIIQFGESPALGISKLPDEISVIATDIDSFLQGEFLEVAEFDKKEKKAKNTPENTVASARARIGERGYHILRNNCEHFAYECVFGVHKSLQSESAAQAVDVYIARKPDRVKISAIEPEERDAEIRSCSNLKVKEEKYLVWRLLEYAMKKSYGLKIKNQKFKKLENGKWVCADCCFSLTHSGELLAVAVSRTPVGIDAECIKERDLKLAERIFSEEELCELQGLPEAERASYFTKKWTQKESTFKRSEDKSFIPRLTKGFEGESRLIKGNADYWLSVCCDSTQILRFFDKIQIK